MRLPDRLNPLRGLPNAGAVLAWGLYDLANQSFQLLVNTLLFGLYIKHHVALTPAGGERAWSRMTAAALLLVVVLSPLAGAVADARAWKRELLIASGIGAIVLMCLLPLLGPGMVAVAAAVYIVAAVLVGLGENFLGSFLPELSTPATVGRVSATGWAMSYVGALALLAVAWVVVVVLEFERPAEWRWLFLFAAAWFAAGMLPTVLVLRERAGAPAPGRAGAGRVLRQALGRLAATARQARRYRQLIRFLLAFFVYSMGTLTVIYYAGIIGDSLRFGLRELILLALVMALTAGAGAVLAARYQDRLGHRRTIMLYLVVWIVSTLALALLHVSRAPAGWFWVISGAIGLGLGGIGTASRAMVAAFTPAHKAAEFFGLWGMVYRLGGVIGVTTFGVLRRPGMLGEAVALFALTVFFGAGLLLLLRVDERAGMQAAGEGPGAPGLAPAST
ncbi:MAG TPA: MFS transporter [Phycisphaerales bacterium]|nr:MFS transporter [Phycisphaerales bacterium]